MMASESGKESKIPIGYHHSLLVEKLTTLASATEANVEMPRVTAWLGEAQISNTDSLKNDSIEPDKGKKQV